MSVASTNTDVDEQKVEFINQISFKDSGCFNGGYASINVAPDAGTAVVDATGDCETVANGTFEAAITLNDSVAAASDPKSE